MRNLINKLNFLSIITVAYLLLPVLIYFFTWTKIYFAILATIAVVAIAFFSWKKDSPKTDFFIFENKRNIIIFIITIAIIAIWLFLTGVGNFTYQQTDYIKHNTVLKDLTTNNWPFAYTEESSCQPFTYYFAYYIPSAIAAKFSGFNAANIVFYLWTLIGVSIGLCWIFKFLRRVSLIPILILICFSGLDFLGYLILYGLIPPFGTHLEWWAQCLQFPSITATLNFVPHMFVANIIVLSMLLCKIREAKCSYSLYLSIALLPLWAPFILVGILPFFAYYIIKLIKNTNQIFKIFHPGILVSCFYIVLIPTLYLLSNTNANAGFSGPIWNFTENFDAWYLLPLVYIIEFGVPLLLIFTNKKALHDKTSLKNFPIIYICIAVVIICSFVHIGLWNDFCMRVSMPASLVLAIYLMECFHIQYKKFKTGGSILSFAWLVVLLLVMSYTPLNEFALKSIEKVTPIEEYSATNLTKYLYPYQYMAPNEDSFYQKFISNDLNYFDANTPGTGMDMSEQQVKLN